MHRALGIGEVLWAIVQQIDPWYDQGSLGALATTNRALSEVALNALWEEPALWNLAQRMDERLWHITREVNVVRRRGIRSRQSPDVSTCHTAPSNTFIFEIQHLEMRPDVTYMSLGERFLSYARRVRRLRLVLNPGCSNQVYPTVVHAWANSCPKELFPKLHNLTLSWACCFAAPQMIVLNFMTSNIRTLELENWPVPSLTGELEQYCAQLRHACRNLQSITIALSMSANQSSVEKFTSALVTASAHLQTAVIISPISVDDVLRLRALKLGSLSLRIADHSRHIPALSNQDFAHLVTLKLNDRTSSGASLRFFLSMHPNGKLRSFSYGAYKPHDFSTLSLFLQHMARWKTLQAVILAFGGEPSPLSCAQCPDLFSWFHQLPALQTLGWSGPTCDGVVDRSFILDLLRACTTLNSCVMGLDSGAYDVVISFDTFIHILRMKPNARGLPLCVRAVDLPSIAELGGFVHASYQRDLRVEAVECPMKLAELCRVMLPSVTNCSAPYKNASGQDHERVAKVNQLLERWSDEGREDMDSPSDEL
jgi:hypothetical protein